MDWRRCATTIPTPRSRAGDLKPVLETLKPEPDPISLLYPAARHLSPKVRVFIDFITAQFR
jgi:DNA-binding transcriptional LysR family regulator